MTAREDRKGRRPRQCADSVRVLVCFSGKRGSAEEPGREPFERVRVVLRRERAGQDRVEDREEDQVHGEEAEHGRARCA